MGQRKKKKNSRGREAGTNFASPSSNNTGKKKSSPYAVPEPGNKRLQQSQRSEGKSPRSPYAVVEKGNENENARSKFHRFLEVDPKVLSMIMLLHHLKHQQVDVHCHRCVRKAICHRLLHAVLSLVLDHPLHCHPHLL